MTCEEYLSNMKPGYIVDGGIDAANTAASHVDVMKKAYELGKKL